MGESPLVSVVICFLNGEDFLDEAVQSVYAQTYTNWELLLVDDGSGPAATAIADKYVARDSARVRRLEHPGHENRGMSASRNLGIGAACGKYIALLDADDVFLPHKLAEQVVWMEEHPQVPLVYGPMEKWFSWQKQPIEADYLQVLPMAADRLYEPPELVRMWVKRLGGTPGTCASLFRRAEALEVGLFEPEFRGMFEDQVFFSKMCLCWPVYVSSRVMTRYRQHPASACAVAKTNGQVDALFERYLRWVQCHIAGSVHERGILGRDLRKMLWKCQHPRLSRALEPLRSVRRATGV